MLDAAVHAGTHHGLLQIGLGLVEVGFGAGFLRGQHFGNPLRDALLRGGGSIDIADLTFGADLQALDFALWNVAGAATLQLPLGLQLVQSLLVGAQRRLELTFGLLQVRARDRGLRVDFGDLVLRRIDRGLLLRAVQPEDRCSRGNGPADADVNLGDAAVDFRNDRDGPEKERDFVGRRMIVKNRGDQTDRENDASRDAPAQLEPHRVERDFLAQAPALHVAPVEVVRNDGQQRAEKELKHGPAPFV